MTETTSTATSSTTSAGTAIAELEPAWAKTLNENIGKLVNGVEQIRQSNEAALSRQTQTVTADDAETETESALDDPQLDLQPMSVVARRILGEVQGVVEQALKPIREEIGKTRSTAEVTAITEQVNDFKNRTPDFGVWATEMAEVAKTNPQLHISDIYGLAKVRNPQKVATLAKEATDAETARLEAEKKKKPSMSLTPGSPTAEITNERMSAGDAAKAALEATIEKFGGSPFAKG